MHSYFLSIVFWWLENVKGLEECQLPLLFCLFLNHSIDNSVMPNIKVRLLPLAWVPEFDCGQGVECTLCKENLYASYPDSQVPIISVIQNQISWEFRLRHIVGVLTITSG